MGCTRKLQASELVGSAMTYTLFEYAKDNLDDLMLDSLLSSSNVQVFDCFVFYYMSSKNKNVLQNI